MHQDSTIWFFVSRWVWDTDMPVVHAMDEMGLGMTFSSVAVTIILKLLSRKVVIELPQLIL